MANDVHLSLRLAAEQKKALEDLASQQDLSVGQLVRRAIKRLLDESAPARKLDPPRRVTRGLPPVRREKEMQWLTDNQEQMRTMLGEYLIIEGDSLVAHGPDLGKAVHEAHVKGVKTPFVHYVHPDSYRENVFYMGL